MDFETGNGYDAPPSLFFECSLSSRQTGPCCSTHDQRSCGSHKASRRSRKSRWLYQGLWRRLRGRRSKRRYDVCCFFLCASRERGKRWTHCNSVDTLFFFSLPCSDTELCVRFQSRAAKLPPGCVYVGLPASVATELAEKRQSNLKRRQLNRRMDELHRGLVEAGNREWGS